MKIKIVKENISLPELIDLANEGYSELIKAVVDIKKEIIALGGELHSDEEAALLDEGSLQENLWGINIYPQNSKENWIEFDSIINIRPRFNNRSRNVENPDIREKIIMIVNKLIK